MICGMNLRKRAVVILAAGKGTRMKSEKPKVLHHLRGKPLIEYVVETAESLSPEVTVVVVGYMASEVRESVIGKNVSFAIQEEQLGTAHAVLSAKDELVDFEGDILVLSGDVPLIRGESLEELLSIHQKEGSAISLLSVDADNPAGYGRIVRGEDGEVLMIVEEQDADPAQGKIHEINSGIYVFDSKFLFESLEKVSSDNSQGEYYLPDLIKHAKNENRRVSVLKLEDEAELTGVNSREDLALLESLLAERVLG
jgi:bifunctional UDP-N-acetylglucosamine pyrophosphorylase/glucosamine-1-phosphate N-acetyltransferase